MTLRIGWPSWLPFLGWRELDADEVRQLGLDPAYRWELFELSWFGRSALVYGAPFTARP